MYTYSKRKEYCVCENISVYRYICTIYGERTVRVCVSSALIIYVYMHI